MLFRSEKGIDPYYYILYEAQLDRPNAVRLLTPENASHDVSISPSYRYMVDSYSTVFAGTGECGS